MLKAALNNARINKTDFEYYNPPSYPFGRHVFLSGILSVLSGGTVILLTLFTINIIYIIS